MFILLHFKGMTTLPAVLMNPAFPSSLLNPGQSVEEWSAFVINTWYHKLSSDVDIAAFATVILYAAHVLTEISDAPPPAWNHLHTIFVNESAFAGLLVFYHCTSVVIVTGPSVFMMR